MLRSRLSRGIVGEHEQQELPRESLADRRRDALQRCQTRRSDETLRSPDSSAGPKQGLICDTSCTTTPCRLPCIPSTTDTPTSTPTLLIGTISTSPVSCTGVRDSPLTVYTRSFLTSQSRRRKLVCDTFPTGLARKVLSGVGKTFSSDNPKRTR